MTKNQGCNLFQTVKRAFVRKNSDHIKNVEPLSESEKEKRARDAKRGQQNSSAPQQQRSEASRKSTESSSMKPDIDPSTIDLDSVSPTRKVNSQMFRHKMDVRQPNRRAPTSVILNKMHESPDLYAETTVEVHHQPQDQRKATALDTAENLKPEQKQSARPPPIAAPRKLVTTGKLSAEKDSGSSQTKDSTKKNNASSVEQLQEYSDNDGKKMEEKLRQNEVHASSQRIEEPANKRDSQNFERAKKIDVTDRRTGSQSPDYIRKAEEFEKRRSQNLEVPHKMEESKRSSDSKVVSSKNETKEIHKSDVDPLKKSAKDEIGRSDSRRELRGTVKSDDEFTGVSSEEFIRNAQRSASEKKMSTKAQTSSSRRSKTAEDIVDTRNSAPTDSIVAEKQAPVRSRKATSMKKKRESGEKFGDESDKNKISISGQNLAASVSMHPDQDSVRDSGNAVRDSGNAARDSGNVEIAKDKKSRAILRWPSRSKAHDKSVSKSPEPSSPDDETRGFIGRSDSARVARQTKGRSISPRHSAAYAEMSHSAPNSLKKKKKDTKSVKNKNKEKEESRLESAALLVSSENDKKKDKGKKKKDKENSKTKEEAEVKGTSSKTKVDGENSKKGAESGKGKGKGEKESVKWKDESRQRDSKEDNKRNSDKLDRYLSDDDHLASSKVDNSKVRQHRRNSSNEELGRAKKSGHKAPHAEQVSFEKSEISERKAKLSSDDELNDSSDVNKHLPGGSKKSPAADEPVYAVSGKITRSMAKKLHLGQQSLDSAGIHIKGSEGIVEDLESDVNKSTKRSISVMDERRERVEKQVEEEVVKDREHIREMEGKEKFKQTEVIPERDNKAKDGNAVGVSFREDTGAENIGKSSVQDTKDKAEPGISGIVAGNTGFLVFKSSANDERPSSRDIDSTEINRSGEKGLPSVVDSSNTAATERKVEDEKDVKTISNNLQEQKESESAVVVEEHKLPSAAAELEAPLSGRVDDKPAETVVVPWANAAKRQSVRMNWNDVGMKPSNKPTDTAEGNELNQIFKKRATDSVLIVDVIGNANDKPMTSPPNGRGKKPQPLSPPKSLSLQKQSHPAVTTGDGQTSPGVMFKDTTLSPTLSLSQRLTALGSVPSLEEGKNTNVNEFSKSSVELREAGSTAGAQGDSKLVKEVGGSRNDLPKAKPELFAAKGFRQPAPALKPIKAPSRTGDDWMAKAKERKLENETKGKAGVKGSAEISEDKSPALAALKSVGSVNSSAGAGAGSKATDQTPAEGEMETVQERMRRLMASGGGKPTAS